MSKSMSTITKMWLGLAVLALISPIGIILPDKFKAGSAWGEWGPEEIEKMMGFVPQGMKKLAELWKAPLPDYSFQGWEEKGLAMNSFAYIIAAIVGIAIIAGIIMLLGKMVTKD